MSARREATRRTTARPAVDQPSANWRHPVYGCGTPGPGNPRTLDECAAAKRLCRAVWAAFDAGEDWRALLP